MSDAPMTAPTHPEPRPDDEGRETEAYDGHPFRCPKCNGPLTSVLGEESSCKACRALTPHPAPLGATAGSTVEQIEALVAAGREATPYVQTYMSAGAASTSGATDEGLRAAATRALRHLDGLMQLGGIDGIAEHNVKLAVAALRAALHTTKEAPRAE